MVPRHNNKDGFINWLVFNGTVSMKLATSVYRAFKGYVAVFKMRRLKMFRVVTKQNETILQSAVFVGKPFNTKNLLSQYPC